MLDAFQKYLSELIAAEQSIEIQPRSFLLAVSGGLDSVVMTELFRLAGYHYSIAHCNFQLRGKESEGDEDFVRQLAAKTNVPFYSIRFETEKFCTENNVSVQMGARQLRYDWLEETRQKSKSGYLVTAHHADDAIETFFINLLRGTGISGLHGIKARNENIIRPLLHFYRREIEDFAGKNKLQWREDSSNATDKYERNKIRHNLLPAIEEINPRARQAITETIANIGNTEAVLNNSVHMVTHDFIKMEGEREYIHFSFFKELLHPSEYLYETIKKVGFNYEQCKQISESISGQPGKIFLSATHRLIIDREYLIIEPLQLITEDSSFEIEREQTDLSTGTHKYIFEIVERTADFKIPMDEEDAALDFEKLVFPLKIRKWQAGDRFYPLGMNKQKKVSDFLIDNKVSLAEKDRVYVLVSGSDIAGVVGYRLDERFKITKGTKKVYLCKSQKTTVHE